MGLDNDEVMRKKGKEKSQAADRADASASSATNKTQVIPVKCILETIVTQPAFTKLATELK